MNPPATPDDGGPLTPAHGHPVLLIIRCPYCLRVLPPIAQSSERFRALKKKRKLRPDSGPIVPRTPPPNDGMPETEVFPVNPT
jgi:hypothetical protein